jgi:hypothetical protein
MGIVCGGHPLFAFPVGLASDEVSILSLHKSPTGRFVPVVRQCVDGAPIIEESLPLPLPHGPFTVAQAGGLPLAMRFDWAADEGCT